MFPTDQMISLPDLAAQADLETLKTMETLNRFETANLVECLISIKDQNMFVERSSNSLTS